MFDPKTDTRSRQSAVDARQTTVVIHQIVAPDVTASVDSLSAIRISRSRRLNDLTTILQSEPAASVPSYMDAGHYVKNLISKGREKAPTNMESCVAFNDHLSYVTDSPNPSPRNFVAIQTESPVDICNDTPLHFSPNTTDLDILENDNDILGFFQKCNYKAHLIDDMHFPLYTESSQRSIPVMAQTESTNRSYLHHREKEYDLL